MQPRKNALVCPCHDVTEADLHKVIDEGHTSPETVKRSTSVYMGACQGKFCSPLVQQLLQERGLETPQSKRRPASRTPVMPVPMGTLINVEDHN